METLVFLFSFTVAPSDLGLGGRKPWPPLSSGINQLALDKSLSVKASPVK